MGMRIVLAPRLSGGYMDMHEIELDGADRKVCRNCVDELRMGGKTGKSKKVGQSTVYRKDESEEGK